MGKPYIVIGDKTSHGGVVIAGSPTSSINGKAIARVGDRATCPMKGHGEITTIISGDPDATFDGKAPARQGDKTACGAVLLASQAQTFDGDTLSGGKLSQPKTSEIGLSKVSLTALSETQSAAAGTPVALAAVAAPATTAGIPASTTQAADYGTPSGATWVAQFPGSRSTADLAAAFRPGVESFIAALRAAGAVVVINATLRPANRAFLMHWSWRINAGAPPSAAPARAGIDIDWLHRDANGVSNVEAALAGAQEMVNGYGLANLEVAPALNSRHIEGNAIDMNISWSGTLTVVNAAAQEVQITTLPRTGMNTLLAAVGATYGVHKFIGGDSDRPHWSSDGH